MSHFESQIFTSYQRGFSMIELVAVIVILGIVGVYVAPKISNVSSYEITVVRDAILSNARRAQHLSMYDSSQCYRLNIAANQFGVQTAASQAGPWQYLTTPYDPSDATHPIQKAFNNLDSVSPVSAIYFDALGNRTVSCRGAVASGVTTITLTDSTETRSINICSTGYATASSCI